MGGIGAKQFPVPNLVGSSQNVSPLTQAQQPQNGSGISQAQGIAPTTPPVQPLAGQPGQLPQNPVLNRLGPQNPVGNPIQNRLSNFYG